MMIEKLSEYEITNRDGPFINVECNTKIINTIVRKINELVDAVNALVYEHDKDSDWYDGQTRPENVQPDAKSRPVNVQDKFSEQRKWIGKVCWFWDDDNTNSSCGILTSIDTETFKEPQFVCNDEYDYKHCEPVKPDDDIIYKGSDNE